MRIHPRPAGDIGNTVMIASEPRRFLQPTVQNVIEPLRLDLIALYRVRNGLRGVCGKMMILPQHGPQSARLPEKPLQGMVTLAQFAAQQLACFLRQIEQNFTGFKQAQRSSPVRRLVINNGRDFIIRRDSQKERAELFAFADIHANDSVIQLGFFKKEGDLMAVWGRGVIKVDHSQLLSMRRVVP
ncbi:hypothetical protein L1887_46422 [Cichorium endivia]|nr:hypothetical protein L1887_46422 [Cichorium endivia]